MGLQPQECGSDQMRLVQIQQYISPSLRYRENGEPIFFVDAFGKETRFYLDFVYSAAVRTTHILIFNYQATNKVHVEPRRLAQAQVWRSRV
jgi:hypothetical protein